jgi:hypothetical protein
MANAVEDLTICFIALTHGDSAIFWCLTCHLSMGTGNQRNRRTDRLAWGVAPELDTPITQQGEVLGYIAEVVHLWGRDWWGAFRLFQGPRLETAQGTVTKEVRRFVTL